MWGKKKQYSNIDSKIIQRRRRIRKSIEFVKRVTTLNYYYYYCEIVKIVKCENSWIKVENC